jgi:membrane-associated phospholipid phosphatase
VAENLLLPIGYLSLSMDPRQPVVHNPASAGALRRGILVPMRPLALVCAKVGLCFCCCLGTVRAAGASEHPLAPALHVAAVEDAAVAPTAALASAAALPADPGNGSVLRMPRAVGGVAAGFISHLDHQTFQPGSWDNSFFEKAGRDLGSPFTLLGGTAAFAAQGWASGDKEQVETAGRMSIGFVGTSATVQGLKQLTGRTRPDGSDDSSFPSGHTANSFLAAAVLAQEYGGATAVVSYGAASFVGASRIFGGRHHFSDVLAGAVIGQLFGLLVNSLER